MKGVAMSNFSQSAKRIAFLIALSIVCFLLPGTPLWAQCTSCGDCPPPIVGFTSKQMNTTGTQTLTASGGGGGPYTWAIASGAGTLSGNNGTSVVYTAPSSNPNCDGNPVISVTDSCMMLLAEELRRM